MSKILSQEEVEALLNTVKNATDSFSGGEGSNLSYRTYDFKKKKSSSVFDITVFEFIADRFVNYVKPAMSSLLLKNTNVKTKSVKTVSMKEFKEMLRFPTGIYFVKMKPLEGKAMLVLDDATVFAFVELFFGGTTVSDKKIEERPFTLVEQKVLKKVVNAFLEPLKKACLPVYNFDPELLNLEMRPKFINIAQDKERVAVIDISLFIDDFEGKLFLAIPYSTLEPIDIKLDQHEENREEGEQKLMREEMINAIQEVPLNIVAELAKIKMTLNELSNMKIGEIIPLGTPVNDELNVYVEGELKFKGVHGIYKGVHAVKITKKI